MVATVAVEAAEPAIPSLYSDDRIFIESIAAAEALDIPPRPVSGLTVPHHLVAADLIARAFLVARDNRYDRIVVLTPGPLQAVAPAVCDDAAPLRHRVRPRTDRRRGGRGAARP